MSAPGHAYHDFLGPWSFAGLLLGAAVVLAWLLRRWPSLMGDGAVAEQGSLLSSAEVRDERYLRWFIHVRWVVLVLALVLVVATVGLGYLPTTVLIPLLAVLALLAAANVAYARPARQRWPPNTLLALQLHVDIVGLTLALHLSGGIENPLYLLPVVNVVLASIVLSRRQSFAVALNGGVLCAVMVWAEWARLLPHFTLLVVPHGRSGHVHYAYDVPYVAARTILQLVVLLLTAQFVSRLAEHSRAHERALSEAAEAARSERELLEESLEGTGTALRLLDRSLDSLWTNAQWERWFPQGSPTKERIDAWTHASESPERRTLADGSPHQAEITFPASESPSGRERTCVVTSAALHDREGRTARLVQLMRDVTAAKQAEAAVLKAGKLATVGELAGRMAHEINNPVAIIITKARLLLSDRRAEMSDKVASDLDRIVDLGARVASIASGLLAYGRPSVAPRAHLDLRAPARRALALVADQAIRRGVSVADQLGDEVLPVVASASELEQVFLNLILNALDAMPEGGTLTIARVDPDSPDDHPTPIAVAVGDTGHGIPTELRERIFEPFFTTKAESKGSGLGLSVCEGIVRAHGGSVEAQEEPSRGTRMVVRLPRASGDAGGT